MCKCGYVLEWHNSEECFLNPLGNLASLLQHMTYLLKQFGILCAVEIDKKSIYLLADSNLGFYITFKSQGHFGTAPQHCRLW